MGRQVYLMLSLYCATPFQLDDRVRKLLFSVILSMLSLSMVRNFMVRKDETKESNSQNIS